jgi:hypothetical protein
MPTMSDLGVYRRIRKLDDKVEICFLTAGSLNVDEARISHTRKRRQVQ